MTAENAHSVKKQALQESAVSGLALFASTGTLVCCALPILLVSLAGLSAFVASVTESFPFLITLSLHKGWVFAGSGAMLATAGWLLWRPGRACPTDPGLARWCDKFQTWNRRILLTSGAVWCLGFVAAFFALPLRIALGV